MITVINLNGHIIIHYITVDKTQTNKPHAWEEGVSGTIMNMFWKQKTMFKDLVFSKAKRKPGCVSLCPWERRQEQGPLWDP